MRTVLVLLLLSMGTVQAIGEIGIRNLEDERRFNELAKTLRCMVCQNQSIADSNAELALDFRDQVKKKINEGQTDAEIIDYMVERYGDYILYRPPFNMVTAILWMGPFILVVVGFLMILRTMRRQEKSPADANTGQQARLKELLEKSSDAGNRGG